MACHWAWIIGLCFILASFNACLDPELQGVLHISGGRKTCRLEGAEGSTLPWAHLVLPWWLRTSHPLYSPASIPESGTQGALISGW